MDKFNHSEDLAYRVLNELVARTFEWLGSTKGKQLQDDIMRLAFAEFYEVYHRQISPFLKHILPQVCWSPTVYEAFRNIAIRNETWATATHLTTQDSDIDIGVSLGMLEIYNYCR